MSKPGQYYTLRYSSGARSHRRWGKESTARQQAIRLMRANPELGRIGVVVDALPEHDLSPGHERLGG